MKPLRLLPLVVVLLAGPAWCHAADPQPVVKLVIDYGDGVQKHFTAIPWKEKMTVLAALRHAEAHPRGIRLDLLGSADTALVTAIDGQKNEGRGRNWLFRVNGTLGDRSCGVFPLERGDTVLWAFERFRP